MAIQVTRACDIVRGVEPGKTHRPVDTGLGRCDESVAEYPPLVIAAKGGIRVSRGHLPAPV
jgi:hypothetical protein